jgi:hypothetical protein
MAKIPNKISETIWRLKRQLADVIEEAKSRLIRVLCMEALKRPR